MREIKNRAKILVLLALASVSASAAAQVPTTQVPAAPVASATPQAPPHWQAAQLASLRQWAARGPEDALPLVSTAALDAAVNAADVARIDTEASALALKLARMHLLGSAGPSARARWHITDTDAAIDLKARLEQALAANRIDQFFSGLQPKHPQYAALRAALAGETDAARRKAIAGNMERWRWMPLSLGQDYVLVNAASFTAELWHEGRQVGEWRVIVGKRSTPTPVFSTTITGVILNPWWEIPASIVREKRGNFPARLGYVRSGGRYRQKPGPGNALGRMKLVMPNRFSVYMHDTPSKQLFERDVRTFSHGCIRVADALGFAATLLSGVKTREEIDAIVATRTTTKIDLPRSLPVYVTYFTATAGQDGTVALLDDIYNRDGQFPTVAKVEGGCSKSPSAA